MESNIIFAFILTVFAGLATGLGGMLVFLSRKFNKGFLALSLGFSAGVMIYVSLIEIFVKARVSLEEIYGEKPAYIYTTLAFFVGIFIIALIDRLVPDNENPHELKSMNVSNEPDRDGRLMRMGVFSALAIAIHNFPEGLATFVAALKEPTLGVSISIAIAIHNIPEGIAVAVPVYYATKNRKKAFTYSFLSGLAEPIGAVIGYFIFKSFFGPQAFGFIFAAVAGIMVYISLDELLPTAEEYGEHHLAIGGVVGGMLVMALSLILFS